ncbi:MAG: glutaredoxin family protein [Acidimicrobiia bacterium]
MATVRFLTRTACHLCERAFPLIARRAKRLGWELEIVDVDEVGLAGEYGERVPVVLVDGIERLAGLFGRSEVREALR